MVKSLFYRFDVRYFCLFGKVRLELEGVNTALLFVGERYLVDSLSRFRFIPCDMGRK